MNICIGGDLDGRIVELDKRYFKANEIEENKESEYYKQKYIIGDRSYNFWLLLDMDLGEATKLVDPIMRKPKT